MFQGKKQAMQALAGPAKGTGPLVARGPVPLIRVVFGAGFLRTPESSGARTVRQVRPASRRGAHGRTAPGSECRRTGVSPVSGSGGFGRRHPEERRLRGSGSSGGLLALPRRCFKSGNRRRPVGPDDSGEETKGYGSALRSGVPSNAGIWPASQAPPSSGDAGLLLASGLRGSGIPGVEGPACRRYPGPVRSQEDIRRRRRLRPPSEYAAPLLEGRACEAFPARCRAPKRRPRDPALRQETGLGSKPPPACRARLGAGRHSKEPLARLTAGGLRALLVAVPLSGTDPGRSETPFQVSRRDRPSMTCGRGYGPRSVS